MQSKPLSERRRQLLTSSGAALATAGLAGWNRSASAAEATTVPAGAGTNAKTLPPYVGWKDPASLIIHSSSTIETKRSAFGTGIVTPTEQLYIRNNLPAPDSSILADRDAWEIAIEGVDRSRKLSLAELKRFGLETVAMVLQCSGNGRAYFPSKPSGTPCK